MGKKDTCLNGLWEGLKTFIVTAMTMDSHLIFGLLSSAFALASFVPYYMGIFRGQTQPHLFTWLVWGLIGGIVVAAQIVDGAGVGVWLMVLTTSFCLSVAGLSLKYGEKTITKSDWAALAAALVCIGLWIVTDNPLWSVILAALIDALGFIPTFRKSWLKPLGEPLMAYAIGVLGFAFSLLALENFTMVTAFYPAAIVCLNSSFVAMVFLRRRDLSVA